MCTIFTVRTTSCGKVMFSQARVKNSVRGRGGCVGGRGHMWWGRACVAGEFPTATDSTHHTGMHSCSLYFEFQDTCTFEIEWLSILSTCVYYIFFLHFCAIRIPHHCSALKILMHLTRWHCPGLVCRSWLLEQADMNIPNHAFLQILDIHSSCRSTRRKVRCMKASIL